ncbi:MAG: hypothetical protein KJO39_09470 [Bacteroidia bacterium]|nr:hypothetical protein [Bacteroidia bacterium]NNF30283.1 hypothetical protein [Flavobacteriaceae bacterium]NNJ81898.1 hypothetical protein [Flavobacteriaceae bacterium]
MEEQFKKKDQILKKLIVEAGSETPSPDFKSRLMAAVQQKADQKVMYKPLISIKIWIGVAAVFIGIVVISFLFPSTGILPELGVDMSQFQPGFSLPKPEFSKTFVYGMIFMSLFLFQIPFLKKLVETRYD